MRRPRVFTVGLRKIHRACRHDGRNGMFVDHLTDGVPQQKDELVEALDGALQLDAVDQVDRDGDALAAHADGAGVPRIWLERRRGVF